MRALPVFALLCAGALAVWPTPKNEPTLAKETPLAKRSPLCECEHCTCNPCVCNTVPEKPVVSVLKPALISTTDIKESAQKIESAPVVKQSLTPDRLGYGAPITKAPLVTEIALNRPTKDSTPALAPVRKAVKAAAQPVKQALKAAAQPIRRIAPIDRDHQSPVQSQPAAPAYRRVYVGNACVNGVCGPQYQWVQQYAAPVQRYRPIRGLFRRW